ncbi:MAG TPA: type II toxin-antitoxin system HicB family antitoxin [Solirubrobacteraceae bacterium]|nr:type II toxin-antitoxin system HicB family antitoxin [Solirubrobacteraceae bacterium]
MTEYLVIYEKGDDGGWGASSPDIPGCVAAGSTRAEVERLISEAIPSHIELMRECGQPAPEPRHAAGTIAA